MDIQGLVADLMGHFTPHDIAVALLSMLAAALLAYVVGLLARTNSPSKKEMAVAAGVMAFGVVFTRGEVPLSIALVAAVLVLRGEWRSDGPMATLLRLAALAIGVGCGSSAAAIVAVLAMPLGLLLRWGTRQDR